MTRGFQLRDAVLMGNFGYAWTLCGRFKEEVGTDARGWERKCVRMKDVLTKWMTSRSRKQSDVARKVDARLTPLCGLTGEKVSCV